MVFGNPPEKTSSASHDHWGHHRDSNGALRRRQSSKPSAWSCNVAAAGWASSSVLSSYRQTSAIRWHFIQGLQAGNDLEAKQTSGAAPHGAAEKDAERLAQDRKNGKPLFFWFFWSALRTGKGHPPPCQSLDEDEDDDGLKREGNIMEPGRKRPLICIENTVVHFERTFWSFSFKNGDFVLIWVPVTPMGQCPSDYENAAFVCCWNNRKSDCLTRIPPFVWAAPENKTQKGIISMIYSSLFDLVCPALL